MVSSLRNGHLPAIVRKIESEIQNTIQSASRSLHHSSKASIVTASTMAATVLAFFVSCQAPQPISPIDKNFGYLQKFSTDIINRSQLSLEEIPSVLLSLHEKEDSVFLCLLESEDTGNSAIISQIVTIGDDVIGLISQSIDRQIRNYTDFLHLQAMLSDPSFSSHEAQLAQLFFQSLDSVAIPNRTVKRVERDYIDFLNKSSEYDYPTWYSVLEFFSSEDRHFRLYLKDYLKHPVQKSREIIEGSNAVCGKLIEMAKQGNFDIDLLQTFLSTRTNRRLIQNAEVCLDLIEAGKIGNQQEASTALLGALAPYTTFNKRMVAVRTDDQIQSLETIGKIIPHAISALTDKGYDVILSPDSIPNLLMKDYISFFHNN